MYLAIIEISDSLRHSSTSGPVRVTPMRSHVRLIGTVSSWARMNSKEDAIKSVCNYIKSDWSGLYKFKRGDEVNVTVVNVEGYDDSCWNLDGIFFENEDGTKGRIDHTRIEYAKAKLP